MVFETEISSIDHAAICIANMLQNYIIMSLNQVDKREDSHDYRKNTTPPYIKTSLHLSPAVNHGTGTIQSVKYPTSICLATQGSAVGMDSTVNQNSRWGSRNVGSNHHQSRRLQNSCRRCLNG